MENNNESQLNTTQKLTPLEKVRSKYDKLIVPAQQDILQHINVLPLEDKIGPSLTQEIEKAFKEDSEPNDKMDLRWIKILRERTPDSSFRIVNKQYLVQQSQLANGRLTQTEIFDIATSRNNPLGLRYKHMLFTDNDTNLTADMLDLLPPQRLAHAFGRNVEGYYFIPGLNRIIISELADFIPEENRLAVGFAHESGHASQNIDAKKHYLRKAEEYCGNLISFLHARFSGQYYSYQVPTKMTTEYSISERNAWAFGLAAIRKYKQLGVDITKDSSYTQLINTANKALRSYDLAYPNSDYPFSKQNIPRGWTSIVRFYSFGRR